jgi:hypothetical protein
MNVVYLKMKGTIIEIGDKRYIKVTSEIENFLTKEKNELFQEAKKKFGKRLEECYVSPVKMVKYKNKLLELLLINDYFSEFQGNVTFDISMEPWYLSNSFGFNVKLDGVKEIKNEYSFLNFSDSDSEIEI